MRQARPILLGVGAVALLLATALLSLSPLGHHPTQSLLPKVPAPLLAPPGDPAPQGLQLPYDDVSPLPHAGINALTHADVSALAHADVTALRHPDVIPGGTGASLSGGQRESLATALSSPRADAPLNFPVNEPGRSRGPRRRRLFQKWLAESWVKGAAFRGLSQEGTGSKFLIGVQESEKYYFPWPDGLIGGLEGPFVKNVSISAQSDSCQSVIPDFVYSRARPPLLKSSDIDATDLGSKETAGERFLVWFPRFGLGNALRGYCSAFIYALLSGRRLIRWHGGAHKAVLDLLCTHSFECNMGALNNVKDIRFRGEGLNVHLSGKAMVQSLHHKVKAMIVNSGAYFRTWWSYDHALKPCVLEAMRCTSDWCLRTRAVHHLLGRPRPGIGKTIEQHVRRYNPRAIDHKRRLFRDRGQERRVLETTRATKCEGREGGDCTAQGLVRRQVYKNGSIAATSGQGQGQGQVQGKGDGPGQVQGQAQGKGQGQWQRPGQGQGQVQKPVQIQGHGKGQGQALGQEQEKAQGQVQVQGQVPRAGQGQGQVPKAGKGQPQGLVQRPGQGQPKGVLGQGGPGVGTLQGCRAQAQGVPSPRPSPSPSRPGVQSSAREQETPKKRPLLQAQKSTANKTDDRKTPDVQSSSSLGHSTKDARGNRAGSPGKGRGPPNGGIREVGKVSQEKPLGTGVQRPKVEGVAEDGRVLPGYGLRLQFDLALHVRTQASVIEKATCVDPGAKCQEQLRMLRTLDEGKKRVFTDAALWACMLKLLEELRGLKAKKKGTAPEDTEFNIFLATDSEELRMQYVEALSQYGSVFYSSGKVAHTSKTMDRDSRLSTMAEFYLLSRAYVVVSFTKYISTFAMFAAMYGNTTLLGGPALASHCNFRPEHIGDLVKR